MIVLVSKLGKTGRGTCSWVESQEFTLASYIRDFWQKCLMTAEVWDSGENSGAGDSDWGVLGWFWRRSSRDDV